MAEKRLNIRITEEQLEKVKELASVENRTVSNYVLNLIETEYKKLDK